jgi:hypothetical protein
MVEGIGWLCVLALILKRYFAPQIAGIRLPTDGWIFASLLCALGLAVTAGWASSSAAFVVRKGWFRDVPGQLGTAALALALVGALAFGFINTVPSASRPGGSLVVAPQLVRGSPKCAARLHLPTPPGFTATQGYDFKDQPSTCVTFYSTSLKLDPAMSRFTSALEGEGWSVTIGRPTQISRVAAIRGRSCGALTIVVQSGHPTMAYVNVLPCASPTPTR